MSKNEYVVALAQEFGVSVERAEEVAGRVFFKGGKISGHVVDWTGDYNAELAGASRLQPPDPRFHARLVGSD